MLELHGLEEAAARASARGFAVAADLDLAVRVAADQELFAVVDALVEHVEAVALQRPVAIVLDDVQWADGASEQTLRSLWRRLAFVAVVVMAALRPLPRTRELESLVGRCMEEGAVHLRLQPLDRDAVAQLAPTSSAPSPGRGCAPSSTVPAATTLS